MKKNLLLLFGILCLSTLFMSNRNGRAGSGGSGSTGAPGENEVCQSCHNGNIQVGLNVTILDGVDTVKAYEPNKKYSVSVKVNHTGGNTPVAYGFQMVSLIAPLKVAGASSKTWEKVSSNVKISTPSNGRQYVEHNDRSSSNTFEMLWTAPEKGSGPVSFYVAGNGVNANNTFNGDGSSHTNLEINEKINSSIITEENGLKIYPNPVTDRFTIIGNVFPQVKKLSIQNIFGRQLFLYELNNDKLNIDISHLPDGVYFVVFYGENNKIIKTNKLLKREARA